MKKLLAVFMTMVMAGFLSFGAVGCKKEETKTKETKVEKDKASTTTTTTEKTTDKKADK